MDFPIKVHPNALRAAEAGRCAADQNQFWAMHDLMQGNPTHLAMENLMDYANRLGMNADAFRQCVSSGKYENKIKEDADEAMAKGIRGTPVMIVGKSRSGTVEGSMIMGSIPYETIDEKLRALISAETAQQVALQ
ncbi:MAG TPA: DsbA family protein [Bryobacteraceae bacterium]|nr:DsbA family protein [Bryobacteraceae bacterium]